jgi:uncharacterized protein (UPF0332 family)
MTIEQEGLLGLASESIRAAKLLTAQGLNRFAVSRAYYAMFYCAEALLLAKGLAFSKHSGVIAAFGREFSKTAQLDVELHRFLIDASELREDGDYDYAAVIEDQETSEQIARAERFLSTAQDYLGTS